MISGKDRRKALLELARVQDTKGTGSPSSPTDPIAAQPLSVAPTEGAGPERKRKRLVKAFASSAAATAAAVLAPSTEEESSGSPLIPRRRKLPGLKGPHLSSPGRLRWWRWRKVQPLFLLLNQLQRPQTFLLRAKCHHLPQ